MAYTLHGGEVIMIESSKSFSKSGKIQITGNIKEIMKESIFTSIAWIKSNIHLLNSSFDFDSTEIHLHVPDASIPKDGPSAGITICCALVSMIKNINLRNDTAMTGEISLAGFVLPVGGIKEKIQGAYAVGIKRFILSSKNRKDVMEYLEKEEIYKNIK